MGGVGGAEEGGRGREGREEWEEKRGRNRQRGKGRGEGKTIRRTQEKDDKGGGGVKEGVSEEKEGDGEMDK